MASSVHPSSSFTTRELCLAAVMAAVVFLATFVPRIPIPLGYAHLGDAAIFLMVLFCGRRETLIAACFGSALSDLIGGFPLWILPTLIIKFFMADIAWRVIRPDKTKASPARLVVGFLLASSSASCSPRPGWLLPTRSSAHCSTTASQQASPQHRASSQKAC